LDYFFVSEALKPVVAKYRVVRNSLADRASDHYPIVVELAL
jgi:endonuclease/exonuclease/phosphatase family metal-dependent hydrolase